MHLHPHFLFQSFTFTFTFIFTNHYTLHYVLSFDLKKKNIWHFQKKTDTILQDDWYDSVPMLAVRLLLMENAEMLKKDSSKPTSHRSGLKPYVSKDSALHLGRLLVKHILQWRSLMQKLDDAHRSKLRTVIGQVWMSWFFTRPSSLFCIIKNIRYYNILFYYGNYNGNYIKIYSSS